MMTVGIVMQRVFRLDMKTLSKLNFYVFSPAIIFELLLHTEISLRMFREVMLFFFAHMLVQFVLVEIVVRIRRHNGGMKSAMRNSVLFYNSANYGIPINQLAFAGNPLTLAVQVLIMMMQALIPNTYGIYNVNAHKANWRTIVRVIRTMPVIYVIPLALLLRVGEVQLPQFVQTPVSYMADAFIATALLTLGAQIGAMKWKLHRSMVQDVGLSVTMRLIAGPLIAWGLVTIFGIHGLVASALIVSSAVPTSLSSVLLAVEYDNEPEFASQTVLLSTLLSVFTVTIVIFAAT